MDVSDSFEIGRKAARKYALFRGEVSAFDFEGYYSALFGIRGGADAASALESSHRGLAITGADNANQGGTRAWLR